MKKNKMDSLDTDTTHERSAARDDKFRRNQKRREKGMGPQNCLPEQNAPGLNEKDGSDEMEDLYKEEEKRGVREAV